MNLFTKLKLYTIFHAGDLDFYIHLYSPLLVDSKQNCIVQEKKHPSNLNCLIKPGKPTYYLRQAHNLALILHVSDLSEILHMQILEHVNENARINLRKHRTTSIL